MNVASKIDVMLINPYVYAPKTRMPPLGLLSIASILDGKGYNVKFIDMQIQSPDEVKSALADLREDGLVGFGGASEGRFIVFELSAVAKEMHPACTVVYGGPHASFTAEITLKRMPSIDVVVIREGELTASELADCVLKKEDSLKQINGVAYRQDGYVAHNPPRPRISDLDILDYRFDKFIGYNDYSQELLLGKGKSLHSITSRGCFWRCSFCAASVLWDSQITGHSAKRIGGEIERLFQIVPDLKGVIFVDSIFTYDRQRVRNLCDEFDRRKLRFLWSCDIRANSVDYELLARMRDSGCYSVSFGFESASQRVLDVIKKKATVNDAVKVFAWVTRLNMNTIVNVTYGHPTETFDEALYSLNFIKDYLSDNVHMLDPQPMRVYPGTELESYAIEHNLLPEGFSWATYYNNDPGLKRSTPFVPVLVQPQLGIDEFKALESEFSKISSAGSDAIFVDSKPQPST
ncbi:B12-binding domain-containing radical SAM protein [Chloroflexota bacterium]